MMLEQRSLTTSIQSPKLLPRSTYDVAIVGGGLAGLTLACALKNSGLHVAVMEANPVSAASAKGQAYHISLLSSQIFQGMGVWELMRPHVNPIAQIHLSDADYSGVVRFDEQDLHTPELGFVAEHQAVLEALQADLRDCPNVDLLCPAELVETQAQADWMELQVCQVGERRQIRAKLLVAADGGRSPLRQQAGIQTFGWQYWQSCIVAFVQPEKPHQNIAYERFWASGPFAILPLPNNLCRIVWTAPKAEAETIAALNDAEFLSLLRQRYGDQMGELSLVGDRFVFPVRLMQSDRYTLPRLALIGDAAHCCHPVGGQGVNLGIRDAAALAEVLQTAHQQGEDLGSLSVLRRYERWRKLENWVILGFTDVLDRVFSNNFLPLVILRRLGLWSLQNVQPLKAIALRLMTGLLGRIPNVAKVGKI
jgi:2-octaprenyl-6-methoxyphenol hydroxylase